MMKILPNQFSTIEQVTGQYQRQSVTTTNSKIDVNNSFLEILREKETEQVRFSKHATQRLSNRNINLTTEQMGRLNSGIEAARGKAINESLVMMDDLAFIVNVKNNTVITAMDQNETSNQVFTNIDGAVIV